MSHPIGQAMKALRKGTLCTPDGKPVTSGKHAVAIGKGHTGKEALAALAARNKE